MSDNTGKIRTAISALLMKKKMLEREGDNYRKITRPAGCFNACELYGDRALGLSVEETFQVLNLLVGSHQLLVSNHHYVVK